MEADDRYTRIKDGCFGDRISKLHDDLLHKILCHMPLIDAGRTSILSRRWRRVWSSIPSLVLSDDHHPLFSAGDGDAENFTESLYFREFVEGVLRGRHCNIQKLTLKITRPGNTARLKTWVDQAVTHGVEELRLIIRKHLDPFSLPACASLRLLFWESYQFAPDPPLQISALQLPASGSFSSLETLHLIEPRFSDGGATLSDMVSTRCPRLRRLEMDRVHGLERSVMKIRSRTLESLEIRPATYMMSGLTVVAENLNEFCLAASIDRLELSAPGLEFFRLQGVPFDHFSSGVLESLRVATIVVPLQSTPSQAARRRGSVQNLLRAVAKANQVKADILDFVRDGDQPEELLKGMDIQLHGVTELSLTVQSYPHVFEEALAPLLKGCASLKKLSIFILVNRIAQHEVVCGDPTPRWRAENFSLDSLEEVKIRGWYPLVNNDGLDFLDFLCNRADLHKDTSAGAGGDWGGASRVNLHKDTSAGANGDWDGASRANLHKDTTAGAGGDWGGAIRLVRTTSDYRMPSAL